VCLVKSRMYCIFLRPNEITTPPEPPPWFIKFEVLISLLLVVCLVRIHDMGPFKIAKTQPNRFKSYATVERLEVKGIVLEKKFFFFFFFFGFVGMFLVFYLIIFRIGARSVPFPAVCLARSVRSRRLYPFRQIDLSNNGQGRPSRCRTLVRSSGGVALDCEVRGRSARDPSEPVHALREPILGIRLVGTPSPPHPPPPPPRPTPPPPPPPNPPP